MGLNILGRVVLPKGVLMLRGKLVVADLCFSSIKLHSEGTPNLSSTRTQFPNHPFYSLL